MSEWNKVVFNGISNNPKFNKQQREVVGYIRTITQKKDHFNNGYSVYDVILIESWLGNLAFVRSEVDFWEYGSYGTVFEKIAELKEEFYRFYSVQCDNMQQLALYCIDGWSRNNADTYKDALTQDQIEKLLIEVGISQ